MYDISLRQLRYFQALARNGNFGRAARTCNVTQPALSMQIRQLEESLGVSLVERLPRRIALTLAGEEVLRRADDILARTRELIEFTQQSRGTLVGELNIGIIPTIGPYLLPLALPELARRFPRLKLRLHETRTASLISELIDGRLDLCIVALPIAGRELEEQALFEDRFLLAVPDDDPRARSPQADLGMIEEDRLLLLEEGHCFRDQALSYCAQVNPTLIEGFGATSFATILQMVANGYGITLVPEMAVDSEVLARTGIAVLRFAPPQPYRTIGLLWRRTTARRDDFGAIGEVLQQVAARGCAAAMPGTLAHPAS